MTSPHPTAPAEGRTPRNTLFDDAAALLRGLCGLDNALARRTADRLEAYAESLAASASETPPPRRQVVIEDWLRQNAYLILDEDRRIMLCARVGEIGEHPNGHVPGWEVTGADAPYLTAAELNELNGSVGAARGWVGGDAVIRALLDAAQEGA